MSKLSVSIVTIAFSMTCFGVPASAQLACDLDPQKKNSCNFKNGVSGKYIAAQGKIGADRLGVFIYYNPTVDAVTDNGDHVTAKWKTTHMQQAGAGRLYGLEPIWDTHDGYVFQYYDVGGFGFLIDGNGKGVCDPNKGEKIYGSVRKDITTAAKDASCVWKPTVDLVPGTMDLFATKSEILKFHTPDNYLEKDTGAHASIIDEQLNFLAVDPIIMEQFKSMAVETSAVDDQGKLVPPKGDVRRSPIIVAVSTFSIICVLLHFLIRKSRMQIFTSTTVPLLA